MQIQPRSPGFLEPDPIGSASTANLDLSLSIGPLIPRTRFIDCRLKTFATPSLRISFCISFSALLTFLPPLLLFQTPPATPLFSGFRLFVAPVSREKSTTPWPPRSVASLYDTTATGSSCARFYEYINARPLDKLLLNGDTAAVFAPREINRSPMPDVAAVHFGVNRITRDECLSGIIRWRRGDKRISCERVETGLDGASSSERGGIVGRTSVSISRLSISAQINFTIEPCNSSLTSARRSKPVESVLPRVDACSLWNTARMIGSYANQSINQRTTPMSADSLPKWQLPIGPCADSSGAG